MVSRTVPRLAGYVNLPATCWNPNSHSSVVRGWMTSTTHHTLRPTLPDQLNATPSSEPVNSCRDADFGLFCTLDSSSARTASLTTSASSSATTASVSGGRSVFPDHVSVQRSDDRTYLTLNCQNKDREQRLRYVALPHLHVRHGRR